MAEKEYIEREVIRSKIQSVFQKHNVAFGGHNGGFAEKAAAAFDEIPAADVVEVVRCKDCKYYPFCFRTIRTGGNRPDDFCSYGVRKEG